MVKLSRNASSIPFSWLDGVYRIIFPFCRFLGLPWIYHLNVESKIHNFNNVIDHIPSTTQGEKMFLQLAGVLKTFFFLCCKRLSFNIKAHMSNIENQPNAFYTKVHAIHFSFGFLCFFYHFTFCLVWSCLFLSSNFLFSLELCFLDII